LSSSIPYLRVAAGIIGFNDKEGLRRTINSVYKGVDLIIYIDGKFPTFPYSSDLSDDGSRELILNGFAEKSILVDCPEPEYNKRQKYLDLCEQYDIDVLLIIDTDEYIIDEFSDWSMFREECYQRMFIENKETQNIFNIKMLNRISVAGGHVLDLWVSYPRIWFRPSDMHYARGRHYEFVGKDGRVQTGSEGHDTIYSIRAKHDIDLRTSKHQEGREAYQKWLIKYEKGLQNEEKEDIAAIEDREKAMLSC